MAICFAVSEQHWKINHLSIEALDLHGGEEDVEEADHDDGKVKEVPRVSEIVWDKR